jgi:hypothetical protein
MTSRYTEINQHDALYIAARTYPGGIEALSLRMGMSAHVLYKKLRPAVDTHHVNYEEVSEIVEHLEAAGKADMADLALQALAWRHGRVTAPLPEVPQADGALLAQVLCILQEEGKLAAALSAALNNDGRIDAREVDALEKGLQQCIAALVVLRNQVRAKHDADTARSV